VSWNTGTEPNTGRSEFEEQPPKKSKLNASTVEYQKAIK
jgi:hypothetical protein